MATYDFGNGNKVVDGKHMTVQVTRVSILPPHKRSTMIMSNVSAYDIAVWLRKRLNGEPHQMIQNAFPHLSAEEREFLLSGVTPAEWEEKIAKPAREEENEDDIL